MTTTYTDNLSLPIPGFDDEPFIDVWTEAMNILDAVFDDIDTATEVVVTAWDTTTAYDVGDRVLDTVTQRMYQCLVGHTSGSSTFAADRTANPTYWQAFGAVFNPTGAWAQAEAYEILDHAYDASEGVSAVCIEAHTSTASGTIRTDSSKWAFIVDLQATVTAAEQFQETMHSQVFGA